MHRNILGDIGFSDDNLRVKNPKTTTETMIPYCGKIIAQQDRVKGTSSIHKYDTRCLDFLPRFTNHGLCLTRNGADLDDILKLSKNVKNFKEIFSSPHRAKTVKQISKDTAENQFGFLIDGNRYKDLKRGFDWNKPSNTLFEVAIHASNETADVRGWAIEYY